jgi:hypothetical protein
VDATVQIEIKLVWYENAQRMFQPLLALLLIQFLCHAANFPPGVVNDLIFINIYPDIHFYQCHDRPATKGFISPLVIFDHFLSFWINPG